MGLQHVLLISLATSLASGFFVRGPAKECSSNRQCGSSLSRRGGICTVTNEDRQGCALRSKKWHV